MGETPYFTYQMKHVAEQATKIKVPHTSVPDITPRDYYYAKKPVDPPLTHNALTDPNGDNLIRLKSLCKFVQDKKGYRVA